MITLATNRQNLNSVSAATTCAISHLVEIIDIGNNFRPLNRSINTWTKKSIGIIYFDYRKMIAVLKMFLELQDLLTITDQNIFDKRKKEIVEYAWNRAYTQSFLGKLKVEKSLINLVAYCKNSFEKYDTLFGGTEIINKFMDKPPEALIKSDFDTISALLEKIKMYQRDALINNKPSDPWNFTKIAKKDTYSSLGDLNNTEQTEGQENLISVAERMSTINFDLIKKINEQRKNLESKVQAGLLEEFYEETGSKNIKLRKPKKKPLKNIRDEKNKPKSDKTA